jgi:hypothetical protein
MHGTMIVVLDTPPPDSCLRTHGRPVDAVRIGDAVAKWIPAMRRYMLLYLTNMIFARLKGVERGRKVEIE